MIVTNFQKSKKEGVGVQAECLPSLSTPKLFRDLIRLIFQQYLGQIVEGEPCSLQMRFYRYKHQ
ncbi:hypothetical protein IAG15_22075, partial [Enterococcus faecalis]|nr:hypothetical protein [Enterococcus faecalis]